MKKEKIYVTGANWNSEQNTYDSVRVPEPHIITVLVNNKEDLTEMFGEDEEYEMIVQGLRDNVLGEYNSGKTFPKNVLAPYKVDGDVIFEFHHMERDQYGEKLFAYYDYISTVS